MKYLKNRDNFITDIKKTGMVPYVHEQIDAEKINEVFQNDITWGDSLIGRLLNSVIRKAKIGVNIGRISLAVKSLESAFEELKTTAVLNSLEGEQKKETQRIRIWSFVTSIQEAVDKGYKVSVIKNLTDSAIKCVIEVKSGSDLQGLDKLLEQLESFKKFLEQFNDDEGIDDPSLADEDKEESKKELIYSGLLVKNFTMAYGIVCDYNQIVISATGASPTETTQKGQTSSAHIPTTTTMKQSNTENVTKKEESFDNQGFLPINEETATLDPGFVKAIKPLYSYFKASGVKLSVDPNIKKEELEKLNLNKDAILKVYKSILLIKENLKEMLTRPEDVAKHIFNLYRFTKLMTSGKIKGFENSSDKILQFNESMSEILKFKNVSDKTPVSKEEPKKESTLFNYKSYIKMIKEADEEEQKLTDAKTGSVSEKIKDYFYKNVDIKGYVLKETEVNTIKVSIDKAAKDVEEKGKYVIKIDPVMLIVRCFNRAYKLHTTQVIPSGRSGGKVSNKTFMEYTCFGDGKPDNAGEVGGPYRNNRVFNIWETGVHKILANPEYQKIFRGETVLITEDGKEIKNAGKNLRTFMLEMLDGENLYKSGGRGDGLGKQREFLEKYFGATPDEIKKAGGATFTKKEELEISDTGDAIKSKTISFTNESIPYEKEEDLSGTFFSIVAKEGDNQKQLYFYINEVKGDIAYVSYCGTWAFFKDYVANSGTPANGSVQGKLPKQQSTSRTYESTKEYMIKGTKFKLSDIIGKDGKLKKSDLNIKFLSKYDANKNNASSKAEVSADEEKLKAVQLYTLSTKGDDDKLKRFKISKDINVVIKQNNGLYNLSQIPEISNCKIS